MLVNPGSARTTDELQQVVDTAVATVRRWLRISAASAGQKNHRHPSAARLAAVLSDPNGLDFTVGFVDRVVGTDDIHAAAEALTDIAELTPETMSALDRAQIRAGAALAPVLPRIVVPAARARLRSMVGHMIIDARDQPFGAAVARLSADGHRLNINLLGEAVLGEEEADRHLAETRRLLDRDDVDYVSIKVSSIASQVSMWAFADSVEYVLERLRPLYREAARADRGSRFINLDMEEYGDLELTLEVFMRLLAEPELKGLEAGIVLQAYLPDALGAMQRLAAFAEQRVADGGAGIKVRLVKGANLAMETVHAEIAGWEPAVCPSKQATDANYKRVLHWLFTPERMRGLRIGVAGHNLFDIAFAHELSKIREVADRVEFEMLQGMATEQAAAVSADVGRLLLYVPAVHPREFDVAISYLVRRLEENSADQNFMSGIFELRNGNAVFRREEDRFRASVEDLGAILVAQGESAPVPRRRQDRSAPCTSNARLGEFVNEPDTDPSLPANQRWAAALITEAFTPGWLDTRPTPAPLPSPEAVDAAVTTGREAAAAWRALGARARGEILMRAADVFAARRGEFLATMAVEAGKTLAQSDPEVSEAIDFIRYYAGQALELEAIPGAEFTPDALVLVTPPWNFPVAIPTGSTVSALAVGASVIHKPSSPTPHCSALLVDCLWQAGVPRAVLQLVKPTEGAIGRALVAHPGVDRVVLTGASETAKLFARFNPGLRISAETSGKNAMVITPAADRDLAMTELVQSAFGHAGQKCSAASLAIMVGSVYDSPRFRRQLVDAASSLVVDWPQNLSATVGPLTEQPSDKLHRALTTLEPGESWLVEPRQLDDSGRLWSPGIKDGVQPGSFFHLTECFGPVLGLMRADSLAEAIRLQNQVDFGLTAGIQSLDTREVAAWLDQVQAGNVYVNRGITGAIVRRQPFGGWKKSSVGLGSKAGGPNYLMQFGTWADAPRQGKGSHDAEAAAGSEAAGGRTAESPAGWLERAAADDIAVHREVFGRPADPTGLRAEANIFRCRPRPVTVRVTADASPHAVTRTAHAAEVMGAPLRYSLAPDVPIEVRDAAEAAADAQHAPASGEPAADAQSAAREVSQSAAREAQPTTETAAEFAARVERGDCDDMVGARIRVIGRAEPELRTAAAARPEVTVIDDPVTASGRVEMRYFVLEQAISMTLHRFGNPSRDFHRLAEELCPGRRAHLAEYDHLTE
ncbi:proline dehydrogenase family protein [Brevibacterium daeguense]|uniref:L-glutamate gamma-semialdehyde dehydrogenase n=1 Tax=Brevibacterium daeguense TaxID=909936 RepID=A0ABP8EKR1_9MICO|nr:bifunctional proline dehydrogenase/L-glutamate gamma-semialdehyde dehydrogenase [Brevibacterium daeguense]